MAKITFDNGVVFEGTVEEIEEVVRSGSFGRWVTELQTNKGLQKFKVGDYVKIVKRTMNGHLPVGSIGKIIKIYKSDEYDTNPYLVDMCDNSKDDWDWCDDDEIELLSGEEKEQAKWAEIKRKPGEFKIGDVVLLDTQEWRKDSFLIGIVKEKVCENRYLLDTRGKITEPYIGSSEDMNLLVPVEQRFDLR